MTDHHQHHHVVSYRDAVEQFRAEKDEVFADAEDSPIPAEQRADFTGLAYFPVDELCVDDTRFSCLLTPAENRLPIRIEAGERLPDPA